MKAKSATYFHRVKFRNKIERNVVMQVGSTGRAAESLVQADLEFRGYVVWVTSEIKTTIDLIAQDDIGGLTRVQVKSFVSDDESHDVDIRRSHAKIRHYDSSDFDVLAIVDINTRKIAYLNMAELELRGVKRSVRLWRKAKSDYSAKIRCKPPLFYEDHHSFENAKGKRALESEAVS